MEILWGIFIGIILGVIGCAIAFVVWAQGFYR